MDVTVLALGVFVDAYLIITAYYMWWRGYLMLTILV